MWKRILSQSNKPRKVQIERPVIHPNRNQACPCHNRMKEVDGVPTGPVCLSCLFPMVAPDNLLIIVRQ